MILFFDIEVEPGTNKIVDYGSILEDKKKLHTTSLSKFLRVAKKADYYCGHNIIHHDIKHVNLKVKNEVIPKAQAIDTLFWSALLFPQKPYHYLIKDDKLMPEDSNNPLNDSIKAKELFYTLVEAFDTLEPNIKTIFYELLKEANGYAAFFNVIDFTSATEDLEACIRKCYASKICGHADLKDIIKNHPIELAYSLALVNTKTDSLFPAWVLNYYPNCEKVMLQLRGTPCEEKCDYCNHHLNALDGLRRLFNYDSFRTFDGLALQEYAVESSLKHKSFIAVFPTGGGKSLTYQLPALMSGENTRSLTVIISPLQSLMKDQVDNLEKENITKSATISGLLDPIERAKTIERVKSGEVSILYIAPESLRSKTIENLIMGRDIARFVIDEAHCFSTWGQDFRVDYLYIGDFIKHIQEKKLNNKMIPVSCFTATAKQNVIKDIESYFHQKLNLNMEKIVSTSGRTNLKYKVFEIKDEEEKYKQLRMLLDEKRTPTIIYAARRQIVSDLHERLNNDGYEAFKFHGGMEKDQKISEQDNFMQHDSGIMVATNAFGMGVNKDDVGKVIHYQISDSLENYVQEAGRAGRKESMEADCYVLYHEDDLNKHFDLLNRSKLQIKEVQQVWTAIKQLTRTRKTISHSALEIAREAGWDDGIKDIQTRVTTAIAALEDVKYLNRKHNSPRVFANSILVENFQQAEKIINDSNLISQADYTKAVRIIKSLISTKYIKRIDDEIPESRIDYLADNLGLLKEDVIRIINIFREMKILADVKDLSCFVKKNAKINTSLKVLEESTRLERFLIECLKDDEIIINIKTLNEAAIDKGIKSNIKDIKNIINYLEIMKMIEIKKLKTDTLKIKKLHSNDILSNMLESRADIATFIAQYLFEKTKNKEVDNSNDIEKVLFSVNELKAEYEKQLRMFKSKTTLKDIEEALYYLQKIQALKVEGGFLVTYSPMNIQRIERDTRKRYTKEDYFKLDTFYKHKVHQIHIVGEYAKKMIEDYNAALKFVDDYFKLEYIAFLDKYFKGENRKTLDNNLTPAKMHQLFGSLDPTQLKIIKDKENDKIVVAAGPGSGKTRVLVHKLASILYTEDIRHEQLLMLTFSRAAVSEFKQRLYDLIGPAARYVDIKTFHSYAFDIIGRLGNIEKMGNVIEEAIEQIKKHEVDEMKITKMVLVIDEAQDMDEKEFDLIQLLMKRNEDLRLIAVGDDDQNVYEFRGSSSKYLSKLIEQGAKLYELPTNYRSKRNLVSFTNLFVKKIKNRLKLRPITPYQNDLGEIRVIKHVDENLEVPIVKHLQKLNLKGSICVLTRTNNQAMQITGLLNKNNLSARLIQSSYDFKLTNLQEIRFFLSKVTKKQTISVIGNKHWSKAKQELMMIFSRSINLDVCLAILEQFEIENGGLKYISDFKAYLNESSLDDFIKTNKILISTFHKAKGREFDYVLIAYDKANLSTEEEKRLLYVGKTRAKKGLYIHYTGDFYDNLNIENLEYFKAKETYQKADRLVFQLEFKDVHLGYFKYCQSYIYTLRAGDELTLFEDEYLAYENEKVLKFSKKYMNELNQIKIKGFDLSSARVRFIIHWYDMEKEKEYLIIIPELIFDKTQQIEDD